MPCEIRGRTTRVGPPRIDRDDPTEHADAKQVHTMSDTRSTTPVSSSGHDRGRTPPGLFLRQVVAELRKVVWPTQQQVVTYFFVVLVFVLVMMAYVAGLDFGFGKAVFEIFA